MTDRNRDRQARPRGHSAAAAPLFVITTDAKNYLAQLRRVGIPGIAAIGFLVLWGTANGLGGPGLYLPVAGILALTGIILWWAMRSGAGVEYCAWPDRLDVRNRGKVRTFTKSTGSTRVRIVSHVVAAANAPSTTHIRQGSTKVILNGTFLPPDDIARITTHLRSLGARELDARTIPQRGIPPEFARAVPWNIRRPILMRLLSIAIAAAVMTVVVAIVFVS